MIVTDAEDSGGEESDERKIYEKESGSIRGRMTEKKLEDEGILQLIK